MTLLRGSWPEVTVGEVCDFKYGKSLPESARAGGDVPVYGSNGRVGYHDVALTDGPAIIVGRKGSLGEVNFCPESCWPIDTTYYIDRTATGADLRWLAYRLGGLGLTSLNKAAAIPGLNREDAYRQRLLLPMLSEQRRIADILDQAEALRAKRREALGLLDNLIQGLFQQSFGDPFLNKRGWSKHSLGDLIVEGPQNGLYKPSTDYGTGTPILRIDAFYDGVVSDFSSLKRVRLTADEIRVYGLAADDLVINRVNSIEYVGKSALVQGMLEPTVFESNMMRFKVDGEKILPMFLIHFLQHKFIKNQIVACAKRAVNQASINQQDVKGLQILLPPFALQREFVQQCLAIRQQKNLHKLSLVELDALFASLQHRAFRGEL